MHLAPHVYHLAVEPSSDRYESPGTSRWAPRNPTNCLAVRRKGWHLVRCGGTGDLPPRRQREDQQRQVLRQLQAVQLVASEAVQFNVTPPATA